MNWNRWEKKVWMIYFDVLKICIDSYVSCKLSYDLWVDHPARIFEMKVIFCCYFIEAYILFFILPMYFNIFKNYEYFDVLISR
jgi:hypothetical protein